MKKILTPRALFALVGLICFSLLATAAYLQYGPGKQQPCPLCILQRYAYFAIGVVCIIAAIHGPARLGQLVYGILALAFAACGLGVAIWQVTKGGSMTSCLADPIGEFVNGLPSADWWPEFLFASGGCADKYPPILGLTTQVWSLLWFSAFVVALCLFLWLTLNRRRA